MTNGTFAAPTTAFGEVVRQRGDRLSLYEIGCTATVRRVDRHEDGRFDIVTVGTQRFRLLGLDQTRPYLQGEVELLSEEPADPAAAGPAVRLIQAAFREYLDALTEWGGATVRLKKTAATSAPTSSAQTVTTHSFACRMRTRIVAPAGVDRCLTVRSV